MGRGVMQDVARRMIDQMAKNMEALLTGGAAGRARGRRLGGIAAWLGGRRSHEAPLPPGGLASPLAALAGYALLSLALFGRGVLRDGGGASSARTEPTRRASCGRWHGGRTRSSTASTRC